MIGLVTIALTLFGLVMVLSASSVTSVHQFEASPFYQFQRQAAWAAIGGFAYFVARRIDYRMLQRFAPAFLGGAVLLLVAVLIPGVGRNINGSSRWLGVGPLVIQPSEIAKLVMIVFIADVLTRRAKKMDRPELTVRPVVTVVGLLSVLMILQPKLGTPLILAAVAMLMLFLAGARISSLASWAAVGVLGAALMAYAVPYRRARLLAFIDPWADPYGIGLQTIQSQVGIASGGLFGVGLGAGRTKWGFLPYAHSDFIFAIVAEEVGLIGAATLITAFLLLGYLGVRTALNAPDRFGMLLAAGITGWLLIQAFLNIGMAMGLLPITGEPLPFVSAGGSSLVMTLGAVGLLANIARQTRRS
jgi:cell division protein FtsW